MPCFEPVMTIEVGCFCVRNEGRKVEMPLMTPKRFVSIIWGWHHILVDQYMPFTHSSHLVEIFRILPPAIESNASIQHQEAELPEIHFHFRSQVTPFFDLSDVHRVCPCVTAKIEM